MFTFITRFFKRRFGVDKEYFRFIDDMFGFIPHNIDLYKVALIHKSASQSIGGHSINNERLEYLGDAVIESITSDFLFIEFPDHNEGFLTQMRSKIVSRQSLNDIACRIGLDKYVIYNMSGNFVHKHIYGDAFEAMIGSIYLDQGYDFVNRLLINRIYAKYLNMTELTESECDFKSRLIEWCQKNRHKIAFRTRTQSQHRSSLLFYTTVLIDGIEVGHGSGNSKKESEQKAACSVSHQMSDEECADILDRLDYLSNKSDGSREIAADGDGKSEGGERPHTSRSRRRRKGKSTVNASEHNTADTSADNETAANGIQPENDAQVAEPQKEEAKKAKSRKAEAVKTEVPKAEIKVETADERQETANTDAGKPHTSRRRRSSAAAKALSETSDKQQTAADADENIVEKPAARRRRGSKKAASQKDTLGGVTEAANEQKSESPVSEAEVSTQGDTQAAPRNTPRTKRVRTGKAETKTDGQTAASADAQSESKRPTRRRTRKTSDSENREAPETPTGESAGE